jgi:hypothetical protein
MQATEAVLLGGLILVGAYLVLRASSPTVPGANPYGYPPPGPSLVRPPPSSNLGNAGATAGTQLATGNFVGAAFTTAGVLTRPHVASSIVTTTASTFKNAANTLTFGLL